MPSFARDDLDRTLATPDFNVHSATKLLWILDSVRLYPPT